MTAETLKKMLRESPYYMFGTGFTARMLLRAFSERDPEILSNLRGFCETAPEKEMFSGRPVLSLDAFRGGEDRNLPVLAAVHESNLPGICGGEGTWIPVHPYLTELLYGPPLLRKTVPVREILAKQPEDTYWLAVRLAGVRGIAEEREDLKALYLRGMEVHCGRKTAGKRLLALADMVRKAAAGQWRPETEIALTEHFGVIDGLHRLAVMQHFSIPEARCVLYPETPLYFEVLDERNRLPLSMLRKCGFTEAETKLLRQLLKRQNV